MVYTADDDFREEHYYLPYVWTWSQDDQELRLRWDAVLQLADGSVADIDEVLQRFTNVAVAANNMGMSIVFGDAQWQGPKARMLPRVADLCELVRDSMDYVTTRARSQ